LRLVKNIELEIRKAKQGLRRRLLAGTEVPPIDFSDFTEDLVRKVAPYTLTPPGRVYNLELAVRHIVARRVPGAIVECGVWRGGSMMAAAYTLIDAGEPTRDLDLFDTFEGMTEPTAEDVSWSGKTAMPGYQKRLEDGESQWMRAELDQVAANLRGTGYPPVRLHFVKGPVEETLPHEGLGEIALLRLDTDWYDSTKVELEHLFPLLVSGGVLVIDDYGRWRGQQQAVDEYIAAHDLDLFLARLDEYSRLAIKR
jgi:hypothetical protein